MGTKNIIVVPNGVDSERFQNTKVQNPNKTQTVQNTKTIVTVSRLVEKNGIDDLIDAMNYLPPYYTLMVIGDGLLAESQKAKVKRQKLEERVQFVGIIPHEQISEYLRRADIFCRPSLSEGFGNVFVEAMAAGLPVIATPVGGIVDFLRDKETGLFCKVNNPKSIADAILLLEEQPALREAIIAGGMRMVRERYDWNIIARKIREVFENVFN
jgi:glycosyltransferase involved in cell wall biosynthesis